MTDFVYPFDVRDIHNLHLLQIDLSRIGIPDITHIDSDNTNIYVHTSSMLTEEHEILMTSFMSTYTDILITTREPVQLVSTTLEMKNTGWGVAASYSYGGLASSPIDKLVINAMGSYSVRIYDLNNHKVVITSGPVNSVGSYTTFELTINHDKLPLAGTTLEVHVKCTGTVYIRGVSLS
jgi:hypothetical protein